MKTALEELLEWVKEFEDKPVKPTLTNVKEKIWQLLPKERAQMIEFGFELLEGDNIHTIKSRKELLSYIKDYYTQTYEHEKETIKLPNQVASGL